VILTVHLDDFERVFTREVGTTASQYVMQMRVEAARRQLERSDRGLKEIASSVGFGDVGVVRRAFVRLLGITPGEYRELAEDLPSVADPEPSRSNVAPLIEPNHATQNE